MSKAKKSPQRYYFIGINGVAMSGLAVMLKQVGLEVSGSDEAEEFPTDEVLRRHNITVHKGFRAENIATKPDIVVVSAAYGPGNIEYKTAKSMRVTVQTQSEALGELMSRFEGVGVAGVHGKTTTSSMLAYILKEAGHSPSYAIGAPDVPGLGGNSAIGDGKYFIAEADEYRKSETSKEPKFLDLPLKHVIITSIELDHPDVFETAEDVYRSFYQLSIRIPRDGTVVACVDSPLVRRLVQRSVDRKCLTYGFSSQAQYQISEISYDGQLTHFTIRTNDEVFGRFATQLPGKHNLLNATAAIVMAAKLGVSIKAIAKGLESFQGPARRFEYLGEYNGAPIYHDYAHHPTALSYLIETAKERFPKAELVLVFQPHTYSRTGKLLKEFAATLSAADRLILLNIFASAREKSGYVTIKDLVDEARKIKPDTEFRSSLQEAATYLASFITKDQVVFLVGAGDVYKIHQKLQERESR